MGVKKGRTGVREPEQLRKEKGAKYQTPRLKDNLSDHLVWSLSHHLSPSCAIFVDEAFTNSVDALL